MASPDYHYTIEKLGSAAYELSIRPGDVRSRLVAAFYAFGPLSEKDFPPEYQDQWKWIREALTKKGPMKSETGEVYRGGVENTMRSIKNSTGVKIAKAIVDLHLQMEDQYCNE
jgi:hypothetical protein